MAFSLFGKKGVIGVDIGSSSIKVVELREGGKKAYQLMNFGIAPLPSDVVVDGTIMNTSLVAETLKSILGNLRLKTKDAATSVAGTAVLIKKISLPTMTEAELEESIQWEAEQYITNINEVNIDFHILGPGTEEGQMSVLLVGAKKEIINERVNVLVEAGLNPVVVDVDAFAIENMYGINYDAQETEITVLTNIGASVMNVNILKNGMSTFTRDISIGGNRYTEMIQKELNLGYEDAERAKRSEPVEKLDTDSLMGVVNTVNSEVASEITRSIDYFKTTSAHENIDRIVLCGGSSKVKGLTNFLNERLGTPIEIADPFKKILIDSKAFDINYIQEMALQASVAVGLAIRKPGDR